MRFGSTAKVLLKCKLKYYKISECIGHFPSVLLIQQLLMQRVVNSLICRCASGICCLTEGGGGGGGLHDKRMRLSSNAGITVSRPDKLED